MISVWSKETLKGQEFDVIYIGAGTLTEVGLVTAYHLVQVVPLDNIQEVSMVFLNDDYKKQKILIGSHGNFLSSVPFSDKMRDIMVLRVPTDDLKGLKPIKIWSGEKIEEIYGFGCPNGLFGLSWEMRSAVISDDTISSTDFDAPGISGGGVLGKVKTKRKTEYVLMGVHSYCDLQSGTVFSYITKSL
jgi:hypothetical protein